MLAMSFTLGMPGLDFDAVLISKTHSLRSEKNSYGNCSAYATNIIAETNFSMPGHCVWDLW